MFVGILVCVRMCADVHGCIGMCVGMRRCVRVYESVHRFTQVCVGVSGCWPGCASVCGMNFQNTYWRLES